MEMGAGKKLIKDQAKVKKSSSIDWVFKKTVVEQGEEDQLHQQEPEVIHHLELNESNYSEQGYSDKDESKEPPYCVI